MIIDIDWSIILDGDKESDTSDAKVKALRAKVKVDKYCTEFVKSKNTGNYLKGSKELVSIVLKIMDTGMFLFQTLLDTTGNYGNFNFYTNILFDFDSSFNEKTEQLFRHTL